MMVTFVSECEKKALPKTRRVLDAFANRIGSRTWQTVITSEGLSAVKKLLRRNASKNTAVSCHWIRSRSRSELVWIVGNRQKFNEQGVVPVNYTEKSQIIEENFSLNTQVIALLSELAGFFHDVGKSILLFQNKLDPSFTGVSYEPYRHEWVSLRVFQAFVACRNDKEWLSELVNIDNSTESDVLEKLKGLRDGVDERPTNPFKEMPPVAKLLAWLIISHHKLPQYPKDGANPPTLDNIELWLDHSFEACWNSPQCLKDDWDSKVIEGNWQFPYSTPFNSVLWQTKVSVVASEILRCDRMFIQDWFGQHFTAHMARLCLMFSDHYYSSKKSTNPQWQDRNYKAYANTHTDSQGKKYKKQKLDEHNIGVGINAYKIAQLLPRLKNELPSVKPNKAFTDKVPKKYKDDFGWQDNAYSLACGLRENSRKYGFFGINQASTGKGKTLANARIMYGLSNEGSCRFSVALGLRTLTLQTGSALEKDLRLAKDEIALLIGSQAVKDLHQQSHEITKSVYQEQGSESEEDLLKDEITVVETLPPYTGAGEKWLKHDEKILKLIQAPVLVSTIDYLMPANEGVRGGRQIAPMLRLLTSDLVLDEPDDFGLDDLPALCRLVNWAGMLGSRVLLSTATMSPALASTLFSAYQEGRKHYTQVNGELGEKSQVCCAWFDEFKKPHSEIIASSDDFDAAHVEFVDKRIKNLEKEKIILRKAKIIEIVKQVELKPTQVLAQAIHSSIIQLHSNNSVIVDDKKVSIGIVRMANINPLIQTAKHLVKISSPNNTIVHYCVYHGQFPLLQRSYIETMLDKALSRHDENKWKVESGVSDIVAQYSQEEHIFVVLATSVAEVGRDHDYDWSVVEPSSMRSIIQLAGRVQRHRKKAPKIENIHILSQNYKGLKGLSPCFEKPGFESKKLQYSSKKINELVDENELAAISSIARIQCPKINVNSEKLPRFTSFNGLEYFSQKLRLDGSLKENNHASQWWKKEVAWCGEIQRLQPFRSSAPDKDYRLIFSRTGKPIWQEKKMPKTYPAEYQNTSDISGNPENIELAESVKWWGEFDLKVQVDELGEKLNLNEDQIMNIFTHVSLRQMSDGTDQQWQYHPVMGMYEILKKDEYSDDK